MTCGQSADLAAYLKGEVSSFEEETLRFHLQECPRCAEEARRIGSVLGAVARLPGIEPSRDFGPRVESALLRAHPEMGAEFIPLPASPWRRAGLRVAGGLAAGLLVAAGLWLVLGPGSRGVPGEHPRDGAVAGKNEVQYTPGLAPGSGSGPAPRDPSPLSFLQNRKPSPPERTEPSAAAVHAALVWLSGEQRSGGAWYRPDGSPSSGLTGLALLAFMAEGHTTASNEFGLAVRRGFDFLLWRQLPTGQVGESGVDSLEDHAIAATALVEGSLVTSDPALFRASEKALAYGVYSPTDTTALFWRLLMRRLSALDKERGLIPMLDRELLGAGPGSGPIGPALALFAGQVVKPADSPQALERRASLLLERPAILGTEPGNFHKNDLALAQLGSVAMHEYGGAMEARWLSPLRAKLLRTQESAGSWPGDFDSQSVERGRVYATAQAVLILESPSRYPRMGD